MVTRGGGGTFGCDVETDKKIGLELHQCTYIDSRYTATLPKIQTVRQKHANCLATYLQLVWKRRVNFNISTHPVGARLTCFYFATYLRHTLPLCVSCWNIYYTNLQSMHQLYSIIIVHSTSNHSTRSIPF
eukprot:XP_016660143.1 PREDICTED: uncharacterized protein LOC107883831 [Acyrthosiphon pisum]